MKKFTTTLSRHQIVSAFGIVSGVIPSKTTRDVLRYAQLILKGGMATLIGSDGEIGVRYQFAEVDTKLSAVILLPLRAAAILKELRGDDVTLSVDGSTLTLSAGGSTFKLPTVDPDEYPAVAEFASKDYHMLPGSVLCGAIAATVFATDQQSSSLALSGILVDDSEYGDLTFVATDSSRMAIYGVKAVAVGEPFRSDNLLIPQTAARLIERGVSKDAECRIAASVNSIAIQSGGLTINSPLIAGRFPAYRQVIPNDWKTAIALPVEQALSAVRQAMLTTSEDSIGLAFEFKDGNMTLRGSGADVGSSVVTIPVSIDGPDVTVRLDPKKVLDYLRSIGDATTTELRITDAESAVMFCESDNSTHIIMPLADK